MKSLTKQDVLFDETMYRDISTPEEANSYVRYYSSHVADFRTQLLDLGWTTADINDIIDLLWIRVIKGCIKNKVPLTKVAELQAKRLLSN